MVSCLAAATTNDPINVCVCTFSLQLSQLVIMTEDTEVERAISGPVEAVHAAVANLIKVGGAREGVGGWGQSGEWVGGVSLVSGRVCLLWFFLLCF